MLVEQYRQLALALYNQLQRMVYLLGHPLNVNVVEPCLGDR
jgi:hypothetical protein